MPSFVPTSTLPDRPVANLLFLGPTGVGKTHCVETMGEELFGTRKAVRIVNCEEFQHSHEIAKLIGSPPGYLGHRETNPFFTQEALDKFHTPDLKLTLVLFDEIEKASDALWNLMLGIMGKGQLMLGTGASTDFKNCIITMTGNLGARQMQFLAQGGMGFSGSAIEAGDKLDAGMDKVAMDEAKRKFTPEFMNRIDKTVVFHSLRTEQLRQVVEIELEQVQARIMKMQTARQFVLTYTPTVKEFFLTKGTDVKNGARPLKRLLEDLLVKRCARLLTTGQVSFGDLVEVGLDESGDGPVLHPHLGRRVDRR